MLKHFFILTFLLCFASCAGAEESKRTFRIVFPERPNDAPKTIYLFDGEKSQQLFLPSMNFSKVINLKPGDITLVFSTKPVVDPEDIPLSLPKIRVSEQTKDFYIFVSPQEKTKEFPLRFSLVSLSKSRLKPGETLWYNFTNHRVAAKLGNTKMVVAPRKFAVSSSPLKESGYYRAEFAFQESEKQAYRRITEQQWWHDMKSRHVGFIVSKGGVLPKIYFFRDYRAVK